MAQIISSSYDVYGTSALFRLIGDGNNCKLGINLCQYFDIFLGIIVVALTLIDLLFEFSEKWRFHKDFYQKFMSLLTHDEVSEAGLTRLEKEIVLIMREYYTNTMKYVEIRAHNRVVSAHGMWSAIINFSNMQLAFNFLFSNISEIGVRDARPPESFDFDLPQYFYLRIRKTDKKDTTESDLVY